MPSRRRKIGAHAIRHASTMPNAVRWWLEHGCTMPGGEPGAWQTYMLQYDHVPMWKDVVAGGYPSCRLTAA
jgi:hypothetical protein